MIAAETRSDAVFSARLAPGNLWSNASSATYVAIEGTFRSRDAIAHVEFGFARRRFCFGMVAGAGCRLLVPDQSASRGTFPNRMDYFPDNREVIHGTKILEESVHRRQARNEEA
jgi:hypothetical protein